MSGNAADRRWQSMSAMLNRLGLDAGMLAHGRLETALRSALDRCQCCDADLLCEAWLVHAPEQLDKAPAFCPNRALFARVREIVHAGAGGSEHAEPDADFLAKVIEDLCGDFGRSDVVCGEKGR